MAASPIKSFPFTSLPPELQRQVLVRTGLVVQVQRLRNPQGLEIFSGRPSYTKNDSSGCCGGCSDQQCRPACHCIYSPEPFSLSCTCYRFPLALFGTSHKISQLAREIVFSENRICLRGNLGATSAWLASQPPDLLALIRTLDVMITSKQLWEWGPLSSTHSNIQLPAEWNDLAAVISERLSLGNLTLSIDAACMYDSLLEDAGKENFESLKEVYKALVAPFAARPLFRSLHAFFVFWPLFGSSETEAERSVMGEDYDAEVRGKIAYEDRDWRLPHGWELGEVDENGDLNPYWLSYSPERMQDIE
ncbi:hypothetical protein MMC11_008020 [Xylographa trunciseda]|nr:hypothetical protein [Xylographa trunciseda]